jgi:hypothetical protein
LARKLLKKKMKKAKKNNKYKKMKFEEGSKK